MNFKEIVLVVLMLVVVGCGGGKDDVLSSAGSVSIMPLGDSLTYDDANAYYSQGRDIMPEGKRKAYRADLAYMLNDAGVSFNFVGSRHSGYDVKPVFDSDNEGYPGWTSFEIAKIVYDKLSRNPADIILLHIGTNDRSGADISGVSKILSEVDRFERDSGKKITIYVSLIINRKFHDYLIDRYNENLRNLLRKKNEKGDDIKIVDMSNILNGDDYRENTHPNEQGYKKMADAWFYELINQLQN